jgi:PAS domain-containing protein
MRALYRISRANIGNRATFERATTPLDRFRLTPYQDDTPVHALAAGTLFFLHRCSATHPRCRFGKTKEFIDTVQLYEGQVSDSLETLKSSVLVLYRQPAVWARYEKYIAGGIVVIVVQVLLMAGVLWERARKRTMEADLCESEERFHHMVDTVPALVWMSDANGKITFRMRNVLSFLARIQRPAFASHGWPIFIPTTCGVFELQIVRL